MLTTIKPSIVRMVQFFRFGFTSELTILGEHMILQKRLCFPLYQKARKPRKDARFKNTFYEVSYAASNYFF